nr:MAG: DNA pilot protein [Microviridae sp.]
MGLFSGLSNLNPFKGGIGGTFQNIMSGPARSIGSVYDDYSGAAANREFQQAYNDQIFAREDNAVQRRKADLLAAGLSPTLAAGSSAGSGGTTSPLKSSNPMDMMSMIPGVIGAVTSALKMPHDISRTDSDAAASDASAAASYANADLSAANAENVRAQTPGHKADTQQKEQEAAASKEYGYVPKTTSGKAAQELGQFVDHITGKINNYLKKPLPEKLFTPGSNNTKKVYNRSGNINSPGTSETYPKQ